MILPVLDKKVKDGTIDIVALHAQIYTGRSGTCMHFMDSVLEQKDRPSVFTLVMTGEADPMARHIAVIIDRKIRRPDDVVFKKFPGGGVKGNELPEVAACLEVKEETGLRGINLMQCILEVHKTSRTSHGIHKDLFFFSDPVDGMRPLKPERDEEIEYAGWETTADVHRQIAANKFIPNHSYAFLWFLLREEFLRTKDPILLGKILSDRGLCRWGVDRNSKKLILCFFPGCTENHHEVDVSFGVKSQCIAVEGKVRFILFFGDYFEEYFLFCPTEKQESYTLPTVFSDRPMQEKELLQYASENFGGMYEWIGCQKGDGSTVFLRLVSPLAECTLVPRRINTPLGTAFSMPYEDWRALVSAFPLIEGARYQIGGREYSPKVNSEWKATWRDHVA